MGAAGLPIDLMLPRLLRLALPPLPPAVLSTSSGNSTCSIFRSSSSTNSISNSCKCSSSLPRGESRGGPATMSPALTLIGCQVGRRCPSSPMLSLAFPRRSSKATTTPPSRGSGRTLLEPAQRPPCQLPLRTPTPPPPRTTCLSSKGGLLPSRSSQTWGTSRRYLSGSTQADPHQLGSINSSVGRTAFRRRHLPPPPPPSVHRHLRRPRTSAAARGLLPTGARWGHRAPRCRCNNRPYRRARGRATAASLPPHPSLVNHTWLRLRAQS